MPIDPSKTPILPAIIDLQILKIEYRNTGKLAARDIEKLFDTCQWLMEVVDRMEGDSDWWMACAPKDLLDQYLRDVHGFTDKDFKRIEESGKRIHEKLMKMIEEKKDDK